MIAIKAKEIWEHFLSIGDWVDREQTVDRIIIGDPEKEIKNIMVTWIASFDAVKEAVRSRADLLITHEPTFWVHSNELETMDTSGIGIIKKTFIAENELVILRCHDAWDKMPKIGITWAWAKFLGFDTLPVCISPDGWLHRYDIDPVPFGEFAERIAAKTSLLGELVIQAIGGAMQPVSRVSIGTGCITDPVAAKKMGCDVSIVTDDGTWYWREMQRAMDDNYPLIRVNHGTSEEPGMVTLTEYIKKTFPGLAVRHFPYAARYRVVGNGLKMPGDYQQ